MASRRDELNAYTFAKRRLVASFLQPSPSGTEEGAPRALRAVAPGVITGVVVMAIFGAWGMFKPQAPKGWQDPGAHVIVADKSTTRYVVLNTDGHKQLHPVLNYSSAKLLLSKADGGDDILNVDEGTLDSGKVPHGATLGIPYAPDRLPTPGEAAQQKRWAVCEQQSEGGRAVQKQSFVFAGADAKKIDDEQRLRGGDVLYVQAAGQSYMVDATGRKYKLPDNNALIGTLMGRGSKPQRVSADWLDTLKEGSEIRYPSVGPGVNTPTQAPGFHGAEQAGRVGMVLRTGESKRQQYYVVLKDRIAPVTDFTAQLLLNDRTLSVLGQGGRPLDVNGGDITAVGRPFDEGSTFRWPKAQVAPVNAVKPGTGDRDTVCTVLRHVAKSGRTTLSTWAGADYPQRIASGTTSAYVTPGSGLLFRQFQGSDTGTGQVFLVTDTGLRYAVQGNGDSDAAGSPGDKDKKKSEQSQDEERVAQKLLGYGDITPVPVPVTWAELLPTGPRLDTKSAQQPQGS
ncbi:type VII secretion protein EccB [Streptomyces olivaceiscleroticus]|uniref:Type VII secretion protein EccB n=1 Tax=Streptomyces olivaceiscleroticus TaxID=68245 RepID=A0ABP3JR59_9ACTN